MPGTYSKHGFPGIEYSKRPLSRLNTPCGMTVSFCFGEDSQGLNWPSSPGNLLQRCAWWELVLPYVGGSDRLDGHRGRLGCPSALGVPRWEPPPWNYPRSPVQPHLSPRACTSPAQGLQIPQSLWRTQALSVCGLVPCSHLLCLQTWSCGSLHFTGTNRWTLSSERLPVDL